MKAKKSISVVLVFSLLFVTACHSSSSVENDEQSRPNDITPNWMFRIFLLVEKCKAGAT